MIIFKTESKLQIIKEAVILTNNTLDNFDFWHRAILNLPNQFKDSDIGIKQLYQIFNESKIIADVKTYRKWNPWSSEIAMFDPSRPFDVNLNDRVLCRNFASLAGSIIHEATHLLDNKSPCSFGHPYKNFDRKLHAPYAMGAFAEDFLNGKY